ncbi:hypothetical protein ACO0LO_18075 [Undibacterium sp. TJN25]|uniref:hypothetical protein n=1 Tax=Undibacterium sp. TJN25 TaxID=3413056 RepID=UPI003BF08224
MDIIAIKKSRTDKHDTLRFVRADGSSEETQMPRQGILPHDLVHYVVESALPLAHGFLSLVARGAGAKFVMQEVHTPGNAAIEQQAAQTEAIVEALQAQLWAGYFDRQAFIEGAATACDARDQPAYDFKDADVEVLLYQPAIRLAETWAGVAYHDSMSLPFKAG